MKVHLGIDNIYAAKRWPEPDEWGRQITERWGLKHVQFCFDLLDPRTSEDARKSMCAKVREASRKYGFEIHSAFIGLGAYSYNLLLHPFPEFRKDALKWCELASITAAELGAQGVGGPIAAASVKDYRDPKKREFLMDTLVEGMQAFARYAAAQGLKFVLWEPTPIGREGLIHLDEAKSLYERFNRNTPIPIQFLLDVGHQCSYEVTGKDRDTYLWLRELGKISPAIHLQQMDGIWDRHWSFSKAHNAEGVVKMDKVLEALEQSGTEEVYLFPELIHAFEFEEEKLLEEMDESYEYLKQFVSQPVHA
ncbi:MAG TPA: TIM barrel protein [Terriglobia bacterium]|nr:TIM barrel protein [Terriglobia bacterium]